jgi:hypothetical protein
MSYYRTNNVLQLNTGQSGSLPTAWGILAVSGAIGTLQLEKRYFATGSYTTMSLAHITPGIPFPCYVTDVKVTTGTVYVLA